ncbi:TPA: glycosyltransferase family 2 protein [Klebsiella pneumoniae]|uniref:glycosyltransferase family 2 protein n=1 Tax=Klebsiella pneumoniae TaxID=573 RepID=UPI0038BC4AED
MSEKKTLSIVVTAHNCGEFISNSLNSILKSIADKLYLCEIIMVNDSSTDNTECILKSFSKNFQNIHYYYVDFHNIGLVRNYAIAKCSAEYILMVDGDDLLIPNALSTIIEYLKTNKPQLLLTKLSEVYNYNFDIKPFNVKSIKKIRKKSIVVKYLKHKDVQSHFIGQFIQTEYLKKYKFPAFKCYEDLYLFPEILRDSVDVHYTNQSLYLYIKRKGSLSNSVDVEKIEYLYRGIEHIDLLYRETHSSLVDGLWVNFFYKNRTHMINSDLSTITREKVNGINFINFFLCVNVRLSVKRKLIKLYINKHIRS